MTKREDDSNIHKHTAQFKQKASDLGQDVQELGRISKNIANETMGSLKENAGEYYEQGVAKAKSLEEDLETRIKTHPIQSLLIALGLGFLVGLLLRRR